MAKLTEFLTGIADAIRAKKGTTDPIPAVNFAAEIASIEAQPVLEPLAVAQNGVYVPGDEVDGFSEVTVQVEQEPPTLSELEVTENGEYAPEEGTDGFSKVTVNVEQGVSLPELASPAAAEDIAQGKEAIDQNGEKVSGAMPVNAAEAVVLDATTPLYQIPAGKHTGEGRVSIELEEKTVVLTAEQQEITPTAGKVLGKVIVPAGAAGGEDELTITNASHLFYYGARLDQMDKLLAACKNVTSTEYMFDHCDAELPAVDLSKLDTSHCTNMQYMFNYNRSLKELDVSGFDTSQVKGMQYMFNFCSGLKELDVSNFDTAEVTSMDYMFANCTSLLALDLRNFDTSKCGSMKTMFSWCSALKEIIGFSASKTVGITIGFPNGSSAASRYPLRRLTFRTDLAAGKYAIRSAINIKFCCFHKSGMRELFESLPDLTGTTVSNAYKTITITGNPCVVNEIALTDGSSYTVINATNNWEKMLADADLRYAGCDCSNAPIQIRPSQSSTSTFNTTLGELEKEAFNGYYGYRFLADTVTIPEEAKLTDEDRLIATNKGWMLVE